MKNILLFLLLMLNLFATGVMAQNRDVERQATLIDGAVTKPASGNVQQTYYNGVGSCPAPLKTCRIAVGYWCCNGGNKCGQTADTCN